MNPSLYFGMQISGVVSVPPEQVHLGRTDLQSESQPIPSLESISSQSSGGRLILLPQTSHRDPSALQNELGSILHKELHPSPF